VKVNLKFSEIERAPHENWRLNLEKRKGSFKAGALQLADETEIPTGKTEALSAQVRKESLS